MEMLAALAIIACLIGVCFCLYLLYEAVVMVYKHYKSRSLIVRTKGRPIQIWR